MTDWQASVLEELRASTRKPLKLRDLARRLDVHTDADRDALKAAVHQMVAEGRVERVHGQRFGLPRVDTVRGILIGHKDGYAFVKPEGADATTPDIYIAERDRLGAMHGDLVAVREAGRGQFGRVRGQVTAVLERKRTHVAGTLRARGRLLAVVPQDPKLYQPVRIPADATAGAVDGQRVVCEITEYPTAYADPTGRITEVIGFAGEPGVDTTLILRKHEIPDSFAADTLAEAARAPTEIRAAEMAGRVDLRDLPMVTIDGADAKDLDDAVSLEDLPNGHRRLGVHIADVSHYVRPGSALDDEAYERSTSVYLEDMVVPMLPHQLSNNICSLNAGVDRLAMTCFMELDTDASVCGYEIHPSVIHVDHRMTYDVVFDIVSHATSPVRTEYGEWSTRFDAMDALAQQLRRKRSARGSIMFEFPEASAAIDEYGAVEAIVLRETNRAHQLIEEFMILANETVADHLRHLDAPCMYRIHERPDEDPMERFLDFVTSLGFRVTAKTPVQPRDLQAISNAVAGKPEEHLVDTLMLRAMKQARYSPDNLGHFGLASRCYCHFTSPIRRYPDLMVHRFLYQLEAAGVDAAHARWGDRLQLIADHCSDRERVAMAAERESLRVKQLLYMEERLGEEFDARVTGVQRYGMFVETVRELVDGLVHISELDDDYYELVEAEHYLEGRRTGRRYRVGDAVRVQVVRVDVEEQELDFHVVPPEVEPEPAPRRRRRAPQPKRKRGRPGPPKRGRRRR